MSKSQKTKLIIAVLVLFLVALGAWRWWGQKQDVILDYAEKSTTSKSGAEEKGNTAPTQAGGQASSTPVGQEQSEAIAETPKVSTGKFSDEDDIEGVDVQSFRVTYDGKVFSPASLDIKLGDIVVFENKSSVKFWPASGTHPDHGSIYAEFDAGVPLAPSEKFTFKFTKKGSWEYHDHLNDKAKGVINVK